MRSSVLSTDLRASERFFVGSERINRRQGSEGGDRCRPGPARPGLALPWLPATRQSVAVSRALAATRNQMSRRGFYAK